MALLFVGPSSLYPTIADAMAIAIPGDTVELESGYSDETATVTQTGLTIDGDASSTGIVLQLATGITLFTLTGAAPIEVRDSTDSNQIVGNAGSNLITVTGGVDAVNAGLGVDRLIVDYHLATGAVTGDSTSNFTEAGVGGRMVTITADTIENFTVLTGSGADTITTGDGDDIINAGDGANTITAGQGVNSIIGGNDTDTIIALDGGNFIDGGDGSNVLTSGGGDDTILSGTGADTIVAGSGADLITVRGGADTVDSGAGEDRLTVDYSAMTTNVTGGVTGGDLATGYVGHIADLAASSVDFQGTENFTITTGSGDDQIATGDGADVLNGGIGDDNLNSGAGDDQLSGGAGNDTLDGGDGFDTAIYSGRRGEYTITDNGDGTTTVTDNRLGSPDGTDTLTAIENFHFSNSAPTGSVDISGPAVEGNILTASNTVADDDGLGGLSYQWQADGTDITGATSTTLALAQDQVGKVITVVASYTDQQGTAESVASGPTADVTPANFRILNITTSATTTAAGDVYAGPVAGLQHQFAGITTDSLNITSFASNAFIHGGSGMDGIDVSHANGDNILDGGGGSNFLTAGTGNDTFYMDNRNPPPSPVFSTIVNFHSGDNATIWGVNATDFAMLTLDNQGAAGFTGLDLIFSAQGHMDTSFVLAGYSNVDLTNGRLSQSFGTTPDLPGLAGSQYLTIHAN